MVGLIRPKKLSKCLIKTQRKYIKGRSPSWGLVIVCFIVHSINPYSLFFLSSSYGSGEGAPQFNKLNPSQ